MEGDKTHSWKIESSGITKKAVLTVQFKNWMDTCLLTVDHFSAQSSTHHGNLPRPGPIKLSSGESGEGERSIGIYCPTRPITMNILKSGKVPAISNIRNITTGQGAGLNVFDRNAKRLQRNWCVRQNDFEDGQYLHKELAYRLADRVYDCTNYFPVAVELGCQVGHVAPHIFKENVGTLMQLEMSEAMLRIASGSGEVPTSKILGDEESVPFAPNSVDLFVSSLSLHWINDLPGLFQKCYDCLRPDGAFIFSLFGGDTLYELRCSLQLAELERKGGVAPHISPFAQAQDVASLLTRAGFKMLTIDTDELRVGYGSIYKLMVDLQLMGESSASWRRSAHIDAQVLHAASAIYQTMYSLDDGSLPATFQTLFAIGWKPGPNMTNPVQRGSANVSLKDLDTIPKGN